MNKEEIIKLLNILLEDSKLKDDEIIGLIYMLMEQIENTCYGYADSKNKQKFDRLYKKLFENIFQDLISDFDWYDLWLDEALKTRNKTIVDKSTIGEI